MEEQGEALLGPLLLENPEESETIYLDRNISSKKLVKWFNGDLKKAKNWNPHIRKYVWKDYLRISKETFVRVPKENYAKAKKEFKKLPYLKLKKGDIYRVRRGDNLIRISKKFKKSIEYIIKANPDIKSQVVYIGQVIFIPY